MKKIIGVMLIAALMNSAHAADRTPEIFSNLRTAVSPCPGTALVSPTIFYMGEKDGEHYATAVCPATSLMVVAKKQEATANGWYKSTIFIRVKYCDALIKDKDPIQCLMKLN